MDGLKGAFDSFRVEEAYSWRDDIMEITRLIVHETDEARLNDIAEHFKVDLSEIREFLEAKRAGKELRPVVKAHWYWDPDGMDWGLGAWRCSACKARSPMWWQCDRGSPMNKSGHRYCPNCGAEMEADHG